MENAMQKGLIVLPLFIAVMLYASESKAGPYPPAAGQPGSTAVSSASSAFIAWATGFTNYIPGAEVSSTYRKPERALGKSGGDSGDPIFDIVSLGRGGSITLTFDLPIKNDEGWDFAVFENSFSDGFLELAYVEVSSNGSDFVRFENDSLTQNPVGAFGAIDTTDISGLAGKYRAGFGTPFNLGDLASEDLVLNGTVNLSRITHVKIVDIVGDGSYRDTGGQVIYDPFPTTGSAGFDLDAVGVRYENTAIAEPNTPPDAPDLVSPVDADNNVPLLPMLVTDTFSDPDPGDIHLLTTWQISDLPNFSNILFEATSGIFLTTVEVPQLLLEPGATYYWRARFFDGAASPSEWSETFTFDTIETLDDTAPANGIPDAQELDPASSVDLNNDGIFDVQQIDDQFKSLNTTVGNGQIAVEVAPGVVIERIESINPAVIADTIARPDSLPLGLIGFRVRVADEGDLAAVTVYFSQAASANARWFSYDTIRGWVEFPAVFSANRKSVILQLQDGGSGDADGFANSQIVDPSGFGSTAVEAVPRSGKAGTSGGGGCFIVSTSF
jgi:hypothetical protein